MGGGGSSSSQPYDQLGGQYASFSGGTPPSNQFNWATLGQGFQKAGSQYAAGASQGLNLPGLPGFQQSGMPQGLDVSNQGVSIQPPNKSDADIQAFIDALKRLSSQGKSGGSYYYVDPSSQGYGQGAGMLPQGTQPGF